MKTKMRFQALTTAIAAALFIGAAGCKGNDNTNLIMTRQATDDVQRAQSAGDAPSAFDVIPAATADCTNDGDIGVISGAIGPARSALIVKGSCGVFTTGSGLSCPKYCRAVPNDPGNINFLIEAVNLPFIKISDLVADSIKHSFNKGSIVKFTITGAAQKWLASLGAAYIGMSPGRTKDNNQEIILSGYNKSGKMLGDKYYAVKADYAALK